MRPRLVSVRNDLCLKRSTILTDGIYVCSGHLGPSRSLVPLPLAVVPYLFSCFDLPQYVVYSTQESRGCRAHCRVFHSIVSSSPVL